MKKIHRIIIQKQASAIKRALKYRDRERQERVYRREDGTRIVKKREPMPEFINKQNNAWDRARDMAKHASVHKLASVFRGMYSADWGDMQPFRYMEAGRTRRTDGKRILDNIFLASFKDVFAFKMIGDAWYARVWRLRREDLSVVRSHKPSIVRRHAVSTRAGYEEVVGKEPTEQ